MEVLISVGISVLSGILVELSIDIIHKWLDRRKERKAQEKGV